MQDKTSESSLAPTSAAGPAEARPRAHTAATLQPGMVVDGYRLIEKRHAGGMAALWRVEPVDAASAAGPLLMKVPHFGTGEDRSAIVGFEVEQMILPRLSGPHVPKVFAMGDFAVLPHLVMEEIPGESLEALAKTAPMPEGEVVRLGIALAMGLADLHRQRLVHLDLKPANILMRPDGRAVFVDFGLSRHADLPDLLAEESDKPMGTGGYIAPEQLSAVRSDPRSDIYALGIILYRLCTGVLPFGEPTTPAGMRQRIERDPEPPAARNSAVSGALQTVILRAMAVDPAARYPNALQFAFDLRHLDQVKVVAPTARGGAGLLGWFFGKKRALPTTPAAGRAQTLTRPAPIVMAAVDLSDRPGELEDLIRLHVQRVLEAEGHARLACCTVLKTALVALDSETDSEGRNFYVQRLVELKDWARPLGADLLDKASFHVLEGTNPAQALVDYARHNGVDHLVMGARASSTMRRYLGSVSSEVVAEAPCTVTVVRV